MPVYIDIGALGNGQTIIAPILLYSVSALWSMETISFSNIVTYQVTVRLALDKSDIPYIVSTFNFSRLEHSKK